MSNQFKDVPAALQKQVILRLGLGILALLLSVIVSVYYRSLYFSLPCFLLSAVLFAYGGILFYNCIKKRYLVLQGVCVDVLTTRVRRRIKSVTLMIDEKNLKLPVQKRVQAVKEGDTVTVYLSEKAPVYEDGVNYVVYSCYALEVRKEYDDEQRKRKIVQDP